MENMRPYKFFLRSSAMEISAFKATIPVAFGYLPLGIAFGVLLQNLGIQWYWATAMGLFVFAGAAQFMAVTLLSQKVGLMEVFTLTLLLNLRHFFYGLVLIEKYRSFGKAKFYAIFGLTDETFSVISTSQFNSQGNKKFVLEVTFFNHLWWTVGCTLGALLRSTIKFDSSGFEFSLTCLFIVLLLEQWFHKKNLFPVLLAFGCGMLSLAVFKGENFLLTSIAAVATISFLTRGYRL